MAVSARLKAVCVASGLTTAWIGGSTAASAGPIDMEYGAFPGEVNPVQEEAGVTFKKKATKKKVATKKKATKKKATSRKKVAVYAGADGVLRGTAAQKVTPTDDGEMSEFDYLLDFYADRDEVFMSYHILAVQDVEGMATPQLSMLIPNDMAASYEGMGFSQLFPMVDEMMLMDAILTENFDYLTMAVLSMPSMTAHLSGDMLTAGIDGAWLTFYSNGTRAETSEVIADVTGTIETVPAPWSVGVVAFGVLVVPVRRRR